MHELSIALSIVDTVIEEFAQHNLGRIAAVHVKVGVFSGVVPDALRASFELARENTPLDRAELTIEEIPLRAHCAPCQTERLLTFPNLSCPVCGSATPDIISGRELEVVALEIEPCTESTA